MSQNFTLVEGDDRILDVTVYQSDGVTAQNITGYTMTFTARVSVDAPGAIFTKTIGSGITVVSAAAGTATITITAANWSAYTTSPASLYWDLQATDGSGLITTLAYGVILVTPDVS